MNRKRKRVGGGTSDLRNLFAKGFFNFFLFLSFLFFSFSLLLNFFFFLSSFISLSSSFFFLLLPNFLSSLSPRLPHLLLSFLLSTAENEIAMRKLFSFPKFCNNGRHAKKWRKKERKKEKKERKKERKCFLFFSLSKATRSQI